jgi:hypothetical protein
LGAVGLEVATVLVELLARIAHHLASAADVAELLRQFVRIPVIVISHSGRR